MTTRDPHFESTQERAKSMEQIEYLESERKKIWERISSIEERIDKLRPETESEANGGSRKAAEYRNRAKSYAEEAAKIQSELQGILAEIKEHNSSARISAETASELCNAATGEHARLSSLATQAADAEGQIAALVKSAEAALESLEAKNGELDIIDESLSKAQDLLKKTELQHKNATEIAKKVGDIDTEIFGYEEADEDGETTKVEGLKDKLDRTYADLARKAGVLGEDIKKTAEESSLRLNGMINEWAERHSALNKRIESLLPRALTAGLSHAYSTKKEDELAEGKRVAQVFYFSIFGLIAVSLIPFGVATHAVFTEVPLQEAIGRMPRLVLAILPLYVPVVWVAYSANRRANLSKRLVEEYSHKEVLAKTYEGLAKQVSELPSDISLELRTKLLFIILEISAENPGKLISDYNKSDHPLMDALDKSVQLANAVDRLSRIPGFSKIAVKMKEKADRVLEEENNKAVAGLNSLPSTHQAKDV